MIAVPFHPNFLISSRRMPFPETSKFRRGSLCALKKLCKTCHCEIKFRKALWLQVREALLSNGKRVQSSESVFFLCMKYELLLRSLHSNHGQMFCMNSFAYRRSLLLEILSFLEIFLPTILGAKAQKPLYVTFLMKWWNTKKKLMRLEIV